MTIPAIWIVAALLLLATSHYLGWPDAGAARIVVPLVFALSLLPLGLVLIDSTLTTPKKPVLVDLAKLRELIADLELCDPKRNEYLNTRWLKYVEWWDSRASRAKWKYLALRSAVLIGGALIPALVGMREMKALEPYAWQLALASIFVSLVIAICAGLESLFGFGDIWREKRNAAEVVKSEGFSFLQLASKYKDFKTHADAYQTFAANVEDLILSEIKEYIVAVSSKPPPPPPPPL